MVNSQSKCVSPAAFPLDHAVCNGYLFEETVSSPTGASCRINRHEKIFSPHPPLPKKPIVSTGRGMGGIPACFFPRCNKHDGLPPRKLVRGGKSALHHLMSPHFTVRSSVHHHRHGVQYACAHWRRCRAKSGPFCRHPRMVRHHFPHCRTASRPARHVWLINARQTTSPHKTTRQKQRAIRRVTSRIVA